MQRSPNRSEVAIDFAKSERRTANEFATTVWQWLRNRQIDGLKFRREVPIAPYTVDFCCVERKLVIEVDGAHHFTAEGERHDQARDAFLRSSGYRILRIEGYAVLRDGKGVLEAIQRFVAEEDHSQQNPSPPAPLP